MAASDFLIPQGMTLAGAGETLAVRLHASNGRWSETDRSYYDSFDGLLREAGLLVVHELGQLALVDADSGELRAALPASKPTKPLFASDLPPGRLRDQLAEVLEVRALLPLVEVHYRERLLAVIDGELKTVVRLRLAQPAVGPHELRPRVRIVGVRGYDKALGRVSRTLADELGFPAADERLVDEAVRVSGGVPGGTPAKISVSLAPSQRVDAAAAAVLLSLLDVIEANLEGTIADLDTEFLHDLRVSVRRSRAVQRELRRAFPPAELERFRDGFRWLQEVTGATRDLDVYVLDFGDMSALVPDEERRDLEPVLGVLRARRAAARRRMVRSLRSPRTTSLLGEWRAFLGGLELMPGAGRPGAEQSIAEVAGARIAKVYRRMVKMGDAIDPDSPPEAYHELRKKGKELRYLLELFGAPLYPPDVVKPMVRSLKSLQDVLGRHQDRAVQVATLRSMSAEIAAADGGARALMAMGVLVERLGEDQRAARASFAERFEAFASPAQRRLVRDTFR